MDACLTQTLHTSPHKYVSLVPVTTCSQALTRGALLAVERAPGAPEAVLAGLMHVVPPVHARALLRTMAKQGLLVQHSLPAARVAAPPRPSLLRGWGRSGGVGGSGQQVVAIPQMLHYYSIIPEKGGSAMGFAAQEHRMAGPLCCT